MSGRSRRNSLTATTTTSVKRLVSDVEHEIYKNYFAHQRFSNAQETSPLRPWINQLTCFLDDELPEIGYPINREGDLIFSNDELDEIKLYLRKSIHYHNTVHFKTETGLLPLNLPAIVVGSWLPGHQHVKPYALILALVSLLRVKHCINDSLPNADDLHSNVEHIQDFIERKHHDRSERFEHLKTQVLGAWNSGGFEEQAHLYNELSMMITFFHEFLTERGKKCEELLGYVLEDNENYARWLTLEKHTRGREPIKPKPYLPLIARALLTDTADSSRLHPISPLALPSSSPPTHTPTPKLISRSLSHLSPRKSAIYNP